MAGRLAVDLFTVMAADALQGNNAVIHCHRQPAFSGFFVAGTAICRYRQMIFRLPRGNLPVMALPAHVHGCLFMRKCEIVLLRINMTFVAG